MAANYKAIGEKVDKAGGIIAVTMEEIRDAAGLKKLGVNVVDEISRGLKGVGLDHAPAKLPTSSWETVLVFRQNSEANRVIQAVLHPGEGAAEVIRDAVGTPDASGAERLAQARALAAQLADLFGISKRKEV
jgi:hypothetical protein